MMRPTEASGASATAEWTSLGDRIGAGWARLGEMYRVWWTRSSLVRGSDPGICIPYICPLSSPTTALSQDASPFRCLDKWFHFRIKGAPNDFTRYFDVSNSDSWVRYGCKLYCYSNVSVAYRILLTIHVTVASAERSFSKLILLKNYMRSTMSQERVNGLATCCIEKDILDTIDLDIVLNDFASRKARRSLFS